MFALVYIPPECKNPVLITDGSRSKDATGPASCDQRKLSTFGKWHRFMGAAGNSMPTSCVPKNRCGTHAPGWLTGGHPTEEQGVVSRKVCFHWSSNCCLWSVNIKVRNCGEYYVYQLPKTPVCNLRYCAEKTGKCNYMMLYNILLVALSPNGELERWSFESRPGEVQRDHVHDILPERCLSSPM